MKKLIISTFLLVGLCSHDLYFKTNSYFLNANQNSEVFIYNGTFDKSENTISRDRIITSTVTGPDYKFEAKDADWYDKGKATHLRFKTGKSGTYLAGVSTRSRVIELSAEDFNSYLEHDGVVNVLEERKQSGKDGNSARESYAKSAKILLQVGDSKTDDYKDVMGYPVEFIPLSNPYSAKSGSKLSFQLLKDGKPLANQLVYAGNRAPSEKPDTHGHTHDDAAMKTDGNGKFTIDIDHAGYWYLRTIHMVESDDPNLEYVSNWGTLTFEVK